jgi:hypothetical protein
MRSTKQLERKVKARDVQWASPVPDARPSVTSRRLDPPFSETNPVVCNYPSLFTLSPFDFDGQGGGPRPSGAPRIPVRDQPEGTYLACLPARNIRPSDLPSTWARPAPPR